MNYLYSTQYFCRETDLELVIKSVIHKIMLYCFKLKQFQTKVYQKTSDELINFISNLIYKLTTLEFVLCLTKYRTVLYICIPHDCNIDKKA